VAIALLHDRVFKSEYSLSRIVAAHSPPKDIAQKALKSQTYNFSQDANTTQHCARINLFVMYRRVT